MNDPAGTQSNPDPINPPPLQLHRPRLEDVLHPPLQYHWGGKLQDKPPPGKAVEPGYRDRQLLKGQALELEDLSRQAAQRGQVDLSAEWAREAAALRKQAEQTAKADEPATKPVSVQPAPDTQQTKTPDDPRYSVYLQLGLAGSPTLDKPGTQVGASLLAAARLNVAVSVTKDLKLFSGPTIFVSGTGGRQDKPGVPGALVQSVAGGFSGYLIKGTLHLGSTKLDLGLQLSDQIQYKVTGTSSTTYALTNVASGSAVAELHLDTETSVLAGIGLSRTDLLKTDAPTPPPTWGLPWSVVVRRTFNFP